MFGLAQVRTLQKKLDLILALTVGLALLLASGALLVVEAGKEWRGAKDSLAAQAEIVGLASEAALAFGDTKVGEQNLRVLQALPQVTAAALYDTQGRQFARFLAPGADATQLPPSAPPIGMRFGLQTASVVRPVLSNGEAIGRVYVAVRHGVLQEVGAYLGLLVFTVLVSMFGALLLARRLQHSLTGPIREVSGVARTVLEEGRFDVRARKRSADEVGQLVDAFNAMLDELGLRARVLQETNEALRSSEARYQLAVRGSSAGLWDWDIDGGTMFYSPRLRGTLGYSEEEFPGVPGSLAGRMHPEDRPAVDAALQAHLRDDVPFQVECRVRDHAGQWRWFLVAGMAARDDAGRAYRMAGSLIDISERKASELLLQQSNRAKDAFLATLAHELRNPLAPLRTGLQILKNPRAAPAMQERTLGMMERQLTHMVRLIDDLLDISRINSGKIRLELAQASLRAALQTALELARPAIDAAGHTLQVELPDPDIALQGDETRLAQVFGNLLNNAARYTPAGGSIRVRAWREGDEACVEVRDNGVGIPPEMLERVFSLFTQVEGNTGRAAAGGLGIGLFLVRTLVEMHGGRVTASSEGKGHGATFTVRLPCLPPASAPAPADDSAPVPRSGEVATRVLVVDDNVDAAETLAVLLEMLGVQARQAHSGQAALESAREFQPDVVLLDIGLPDLDGYDVARRLRADPALAPLKLVALTGWGGEQDRERAREAGFDHHLTKPVDPALLEDLLRRLA